MEEVRYISSKKKRIEFEKKVIGVDLTSILIASIVGAILLVAFGYLLYRYGLDTKKTIIAILTGILIYSIILYLIIKQKKIKEIKEVDIPIQRIIVEKPIIQVVDRIIIKKVKTPVYIERPRKKLNIPHYDYFGSTETKTYHKRNCRFRKLIKRKYQLSNNSATFFKKRKFKPCKVCLKKKVKKKSKK